MKPEETIDFHIRWAWHRISRGYNSVADRHGFSMSVGYVLLSIDRQGTPSTALGPKMGMESRSLTRTLRNMEADGLVFRETDESDRRKVLVKLTDKGKRYRKKAKDTVIDFNEQVREELGEKEIESLISTLSKLNEIIDNQKFFD